VTSLDTTVQTIPVTKLDQANPELLEELLEVVAGVAAKGAFTMGHELEAFEAEFAAYCETGHAVGVSSGTEALVLALRALGIGPGDEVVTSAYSFFASAGTIANVGATPVFVDIDPRTYNLDPHRLEGAITPRTKAVIAVHLYGQCCDLGAVKAVCDKRQVWLIEDAAQAIHAVAGPDGATAGTVGHLGCLSFFSKKQLSLGEGGMVLTADAAVADRVRLLRSHAMTSGTWDRHRGHEDSYDIVDVGFNFRLDEPRAALGLSRLPRVGDAISHRRAVVREYRARLGGLDGVTLMWDDAAVEAGSHFAFPILFDSGPARARAAGVIADRGVQTTRYPVLHELTEYASYAARGTLPHAEEAADRHLALPLSASLSEEQVDLVVNAVKTAL
jgi:dTDP-4-amino-4,6-dideoxygalactose transaminase